MTGAPGHEMPHHAHTHTFLTRIQLGQGSLGTLAWRCYDTKNARGIGTERQACPMKADAGRGKQDNRSCQEVKVYDITKL